MKISLRIKMICVILLIAAAFAATAAIISYTLYSSAMDQHYKTLAMNTAKTASMILDAEAVETLTDDVMEVYRSYCTGDTAPAFHRFTEEDWEDYYASFYEAAASEAYASVFHTLSIFREENKVRWMYICYMDAETGKAVYIIDADTTRDATPSGHCDPIVDGNMELMRQGIYDFPAYVTNYEEYGWLCSASAGITDSDGRVIANVYVDLSMNEVMRDRQSFLIRLGLALFAVAAVLIFIVTAAVNRTVVVPINRLSAAAERFVREKKNCDGKGSAISQLDIWTGDEIEKLTVSMKKMEEEINSYISYLSEITAERERISTELNVARNIQASMLPCIFPAFPERSEFDIYATMTPAKEVGGDFYDFFLVDGNRLAIVMADVSGKGVPAALFMMISKTLIKSAAQTGLSPREVLEKVNNQLCESNKAEMFVTVWLGILDIGTGRLRCANAGHEYPAIKRRGGDFELFRDAHGFVLAGMENTKYKEYELQLFEGDVIFVYTDGVTEAADAEHKLYGTEGMLQALNGKKDIWGKELLEAVHKGIGQFVGGAPQFDDITMLSLRIGELSGVNADFAFTPVVFAENDKISPDLL